LSLPIDNISVLSAAQLQDADWRAWSELQQRHACFEPPSFRPEYAKALVPLRPYLRIAVGSSNGRNVAFLPFVVDSRRHAYPIGQWLMSFQGIVHDPRYEIEARAWLEATGVRQFRFDRLVTLQAGFSDNILSIAPSPVIDLRRGYAGYLEDLKNRGSGLVKRLEQKRRHAARALASVEFADEALFPDSLELLIAWRRQRNREILAADFLAVPWVTQFMEVLCQQRRELFRGRLFVLRFGNHPVAALLGMQSGKVFECVVTAFNHQYSHYSPGLLLFHLLASEAEHYGIKRIHLTRGTEHFKERFENTEVTVADAIIGQSAAARQMNRGLLALRKLVWRTPLGQPTRRVWRRVSRAVESVTGDAHTWIELDRAVESPSVPKSTPLPSEELTTSINSRQRVD
jgi:CelD/BcsL family acetyltransferase involved in cellulose biosynthesis